MTTGMTEFDPKVTSIGRHRTLGDGSFLQINHRCEFIVTDWNRVSQFETKKGGVDYVTVRRGGISVKERIPSKPGWPFLGVTANP